MSKLTKAYSYDAITARGKLVFQKNKKINSNLIFLKNNKKNCLADTMVKIEKI